MKKINKGNVGKKVAKEKESVVKKDNHSKKCGDKVPVYVSLDLSGLIHGLSIDLVVQNEGKHTFSFAVLALNDILLSCFNMNLEHQINSEDGGLEIRAEITNECDVEE